MYFGFKSLRILAQGESAPATVTRVTVEDARSLDRKQWLNRYTATIAFQAGTTPVTIEKRWSIEMGASCVWPCYRRGDVLRVRYLPARPTDALVDSVMDLYALPLTLLLTGTVVTIWGVAVVRDFRKRPAFEVTPTWR